MKFRVLAIFAVVLAVTVIGAWMWFGRDGADSANPDASGNQASAETVRRSPAGGIAAPDSPAGPGGALGAGRSDPPSQTAKPGKPVPTTSSVMPGMPMVRATPVPPGLPPEVAPLRVPGAVVRSEWQMEGKAELSKIQTMLRDYRTRMGENPVGTNAEIMKSVMGGNSAGARLGPPEGQQINEQGELVDQWGTPYFFHQLSKDSTEVRSAGPDRRMWTADDLITK